MPRNTHSTNIYGPTDFGGWSYKLTPVCRTSIRVMIFGLFSKTALRIFPIFFMTVEDNRTNLLSQMVFLKRFLILDYRGLSNKENNQESTRFM